MTYRELMEHIKSLTVRDLDTEVFISIDHDLYSHKAKISENIKTSLMKDFI